MTYTSTDPALQRPPYSLQGADNLLDEFFGAVWRLWWVSGSSPNARLLSHRLFGPVKFHGLCARPYNVIGRANLTARCDSFARHPSINLCTRTRWCRWEALGSLLVSTAQLGAKYRLYMEQPKSHLQPFHLRSRRFVNGMACRTLKVVRSDGLKCLIRFYISMHM